MKVYELPLSHGLDCQNDIAQAAGDGHIILVVHALVWGPSLDLPCHFVILWFCHSVTFQMKIFRHAFLRKCEA